MSECSQIEKIQEDPSRKPIETKSGINLWGYKNRREISRDLRDNRVEIDKLKEENVRDSLTGAYNRRYFDKALEEKLKENSKIALVMLDIDHFKDFNDAYGHINGDNFLIGLVRLLSDHLRLARPKKSKDIVARYGGEEFAIILSDIPSIENAKNVAENLSKVIADTKFRVDENNMVSKTVSMGVAFAREVDSPTELIVRADRALYRAKENGRNRVEVAD